jgi:hypothetical protein
VTTKPTATATAAEIAQAKTSQMNDFQPVVQTLRSTVAVITTNRTPASPRLQPGMLGANCKAASAGPTWPETAQMAAIVAIG